MVPNPSMLRYQGRLERILKDIALRLKLILTLEFFLRLAAVFMITLLGNLFVQEVKGLLPYLPFVYSLVSLAVLGWVLLQGLWQAAFKLPLEKVARGLEDKNPRLRDDVTNALLLFHQVRENTLAQISNGVVGLRFWPGLRGRGSFFFRFILKSFDSRNAKSLSISRSGYKAFSRSCIG